MTLELFGWTPAFDAAFEDYRQQNLTAGRITEEHKQIYDVWTPAGVFAAEVSGKLRFQAMSRSDFPAVGDWVALAARSNEGKATIHAVLPRFSRFLRKAAGPGADEQIVAANVNTVFLVMALNHDFNVRRLERYLVMAWDSNSNPVIILTKADLCNDVAACVTAVASVAVGVPVHVVSAVDDVGLDQLQPYLQVGQTVALLGSSCV